LRTGFQVYISIQSGSAKNKRGQGEKKSEGERKRQGFTYLTVFKLGSIQKKKSEGERKRQGFTYLTVFKRNTLGTH
jgi:hypothetical protein